MNDYFKRKKPKNINYEKEIANGSHEYNSQHGKVVNKGFGGSQWYEYEDGTVKTYMDLLQETDYLAGI